MPLAMRLRGRRQRWKQMEVVRNKGSCRLRNLLSLLNKWLEMGVVFNQNLVKIVAAKKCIEHSCPESK